MNFPINKLPFPKYADKPKKYKKREKTVIVKKIDNLFTDDFLKDYFSAPEKTHRKKST
jgi:RNA recognition motif-containing protein